MAKKVRFDYDDLETVAELVNGYREVNHNYERSHEFNLWFVVNAGSQERRDGVIADIQRRTGYPVISLPLVHLPAQKRVARRAKRIPVAAWPASWVVRRSTTSSSTMCGINPQIAYPAGRCTLRCCTCRTPSPKLFDHAVQPALPAGRTPGAQAAGLTDGRQGAGRYRYARAAGGHAFAGARRRSLLEQHCLDRYRYRGTCTLYVVRTSALICSDQGSLSYIKLPGLSFFHAARNESAHPLSMGFLLGKGLSFLNSCYKLVR